ncbi:OsmC family protein [Candidatus Nitrospira bockiana]
MAQATVTGTVNGVSVDRMTETIQAVSGTPSLGAFRFRLENRWVDGSRNRSTISGFAGAGQEVTHPHAFRLEADEPEILLGQDSSPNPAEYVLHALASCLTTSLVYHAAARGIRVEAVESRLEGELDLRGFLGLAEDVRRGYQRIRVEFRVKSDAPAEALKDLCTFSPVFDIVSNPVPVSVIVENL